MNDFLLQKLNSHGFLLSVLLYIVGTLWFLLLSQKDFNYRTYMSENALLVGVVDETFKSHSAMIALHNQFTTSYEDKDKVTLLLKNELRDAGLQIFEQNFTFSHTLLQSNVIVGTNVYAIMRSRSGSRAESIVVSAPLKSATNLLHGVTGSYTFLISLAQQVRTQLYWAKDIIFLFPDMEYIGLIAWLDAYHGIQTSPFITGSELIGRAGSIQAGLNIEFPSLTMDMLDISYQGINGELPNLDVINSIVRLASKLGVPLSLHGRIQHFHSNDRFHQMDQLISSMWIQASGSPTGLHAPLINFQIPTISLRGVASAGKGTPGLAHLRAIGSLLEGYLRCLNNLQERFHQSFYYYLLPNLLQYISIGVYTPPFFVAIAGLLIQVLHMYLQLFPSETQNYTPHTEDKMITDVDFKRTSDTEIIHRKQFNTKNKKTTEIETKTDSDRQLTGTQLFPSLFSASCSLLLSCLLGSLMLISPQAVFQMILRRASEPEHVWQLAEFYNFFSLLSLMTGLALCLPILANISKSCWLGYGQDRQLTNAISLFLWSIFLACMSTFNISASYFLMVVMEPVLLLNYISKSKLLRFFVCLPLMVCVSPPVLLLIVCCLNNHISQFPPVTNLNQSVIPQIGGALLQAYMESELLGSWTWSIGCVVFTPLWFFTWNGLLLS